MLATIADVAGHALYVPTLGEHETLYGWSGRLHLDSCSWSVLQTSERLFGNEHAGLLHDFPAYVATLEQRTGGALGTARDLIAQHTLLGFFLPFIDAGIGDQIIDKVSISAMPALKMRLGITASGVGGYHPLRCCTSCMEEDRALLGRPSWRVQHQAPAALVCFKHGIPLIQYWHPTTPVHRREWVYPKASGAQGFAEIRFSSPESLELHRSFAIFSAELLGLSPGSLNPAKLSIAYRQWAEENSCLTASGSIRHEKLEQCLAGIFELVAAPFRELAPATFSPNLAAIVSCIVRTRSKPIHALKHLMLCFCMFKDATTFIRRIADTGQALRPPNSCRSKGAQDLQTEHGASAAQTTLLELVRSGQSIRSSAALVGVSSAIGLRWCRIQGVEFKTRPKSLKPDVLRSLRAALRAGEDREVARKANGVSLSSVNRLLSSDPALRETWGSVRHELAREANRAALMKCLRSRPEATMKQIQMTRGNGWMWLYRHDRDWLQAVLYARNTGTD